MAAARILFNGEHLVCAICLDVVTEPVTTPCGHNFCKACIEHCWDTTARVIYQCPLCNARFPTRPQMQVNTVLSELAIEHKKWAQLLENQSAHDILCDICPARKDMAVVSCLVCLSSFCETHLEPHLRVAGLRGHTLSAPLQFEDGLCENHHRQIDLYCKTDQAFICGGCMTTDHKNHHIVPLETEYESKRAEVQSAITARSHRLRELKLYTKRARVFKGQLHTADLIAVIGDRCRAAERQAEGFITELNMDITELGKKRDDLERCFAEHHRLVAHHRLVLLWSSLPALLNKDLKNTVVDFKLPDTNCVRRCATLLDQEVTLQRLKAFAVDVTLDPDTAHRDLIVSPDGKTVMLGATPQDVPDARKRFKHHAVLSEQGFSSRTFYFEVQVKGKTSWTVGVASASLNRKYPISMSVRNECWVIVLDAGQYRAYGSVSSGINLLVKEKLQAVGVFVDHDAGQVSFHKGKELIYVFSGLRFHSSVLHPYLGTRSDRSPSDRKPLTITSQSLPN